MSNFTSTNQSNISETSSLQRSGLNISVGDTKSIVLALQALQSKIRTLEQDRDYHQDQYEQALQAHEIYKLEVEREAEQERAAHRKRETELRELLRTAREENDRLKAAMSGTAQHSLGAFREELEEMIAREKRNAEQREAKLTAEVNQLRRSVSEERTKHAALLVSLEHLKAERAAAYEMNEQLRLAMSDLLSQHEHPSTGRRSKVNTPSQRTGRSSIPARHCLLQRGGKVSRRTTRRTASSHVSYQDPTCSSALRDVRNVSGDAPCSHVGMEEESKSVLGPTSLNTSRHTSAVRTRPVGTARKTSSPARPRAAAPASPSAMAGGSPIEEVQQQLQEELEDLQDQYRDTLTRGATESIPREVLTAALNRISTLIDQKNEQLRLIRAAQQELQSAGASRFSLTASDDAVPEKASQRTMLVNELRAMLAETEGK